MMYTITYSYKNQTFMSLACFGIIRQNNLSPPMALTYTHTYSARLPPSKRFSQTTVSFLINLVIVLQLRSVPDDLDSCSLGFTERYNNVLLTIRVIGDPLSFNNESDVEPPDLLPARPFYVGDFMNVAEDDIYHENFVIEASFGALLNRKKFSNKNDYQ